MSAARILDQDRASRCGTCSKRLGETTATIPIAEHMQATNFIASEPSVLLEELGLAGIRSKEQIYNDIEERILLPKDRLPDHWLATYQM